MVAQISLLVGILKILKLTPEMAFSFTPWVLRDKAEQSQLALSLPASQTQSRVAAAIEKKEIQVRTASLIQSKYLNGSNAAVRVSPV